MSAMKFSNKTAMIPQKPGEHPRIIKKVVKAAAQGRDYYPVMVELVHLLEMTHAISHEEDIENRIKMMEAANPESVPYNGIFWQDQGDEIFMLLDERSLTVYKDIFEDYLNPELVASLKTFLETTNQKRLADYEAASEDGKAAFKKIIVVNLGQ